MSWHPYERKRRLWSVYWGVRSPANADGFTPRDVVEFEMTDPYCLDRDKWRDLQLSVLARLTPPGYYVNISHQWSKLWPSDGALRFSKFHDVFKLPIVISADMDKAAQPGKRQPFYWVLTQFPVELAKLDDIVFYQNIDMENITWITEQPLDPFPGQLFEYNKAAYAWNKRLLMSEEFDQIVRKACWGVTVTHLGHLDFQTTRERLEPQAIMDILQEEAAAYELEVEFSTFSERPRKPGILKTLMKVGR
jgi:hypothetical protein